MATVILRCLEYSVPFKRRILILKEDIPMRIGRCNKNELCKISNALFETSNQYISRNHAFILFRNGKLFLEDFNTNGTFVNGKRIESLVIHEIYSGDIIQLGSNINNEKGLIECFSFKIILKKGGDSLKYLKLIQEQYPYPLHLFTNLPSVENISTCFLYLKTLERFEVLRIYDKFGVIEFNKCCDIKQILHHINEKGFIEFNKLVTRNEEYSLEEEYNLYQIDNITHHVLSIACSRNDFLKSWFIQQEVKILYTKWMFLNELEKIELLNLYTVPYTTLDMDEKEEIFKQYPEFVNLKEELYKIHFSEISKAITNNDYLLINGYAFVPIDVLILAVFGKFENYMNKKLMKIKNNLHKVWNDKRIVSIIKFVEKKIYKTAQFIETDRIVKPEMVNRLSTKSFPLCMNILNHYLNKDHHLKNGGRLQLGLFLKGIGMPLSDSIVFWKTHFTKIMDIECFDKNYCYHIRHSYGAVGRKFSYPPQNCYKILKVVPGVQEYHGCPFKTLNKSDLMYELKRNNVTEYDANEIWEIVKSGLPQLACARYFQALHDDVIIDAIKHPNIYFEKSQEIS